jgi:methionyl aminopeptidase
MRENERERQVQRAPKIVIHGEHDAQKMRAAGELAARVLDYVAQFVKSGVTTGELDQKCDQFMRENGAIPATLNYNGFPKSTCISVNHVVCHGIPGTKRLAAGDILNIDITVILDGWYGDTSRMFCVGPVSSLATKLINTAYEAMMCGIDAVKPGATLGDVGYVIQSLVQRCGFSVVRDFCGHGIGKIFHTEPQVMHVGKKGEGVVLEEGMFFTIEPMVNAGGHAVKVLADGWTVVTRDKSLSAQFEHSIGVTATGAEIFTSSQTSCQRIE